MLLFQPMPLRRRRDPFDHPEWIFELKHAQVGKNYSSVIAIRNQ
jgi:hypothetical protein